MLRALEGQEPSADRLAARALPLRRAEAFAIQPAVFVDNKASNRYTVVEVNARDRAALLVRARPGALRVAARSIHSAHIATYGERAVDVFYLTDLDGAKIEAPGPAEGAAGAAAQGRRRTGPAGRQAPPESAKEKAPAVAGEGLFRPRLRSEAEAAGDAVGPRLGEEGGEDLAGRPGIADRAERRDGRGCRRLERRVERDLRIILVSNRFCAHSSSDQRWRGPRMPRRALTSAKPSCSFCGNRSEPVL